MGEAQAQRIVEGCYGNVLAYCRRHAPAGADAQDLAQETFLRFVRAKGYSNEGKPLAYLLAIARNLCIDAGRMRRTVPLPPDTDVPDPHDDLSDIELACTLAKLGEREREAVELRYGQGLGASEAAQVMGISRFAMNRLLKRALATLRTELAPNGEEIRP